METIVVLTVVQTLVYLLVVEVLAVLVKIPNLVVVKVVTDNHSHHFHIQNAEYLPLIHHKILHQLAIIMVEVVVGVHIVLT